MDELELDFSEITWDAGNKSQSWDLEIAYSEFDNTEESTESTDNNT